MTRYLLNENFSKTDIFYLARSSRKTITFKKYELNNLYNKKDLIIFDKKLFISDDLNVIKNIYSLYENKLYYYFRDNLWLISSQPINKHNSKVDLEILSNHYEFDLSKKNKINFENMQNLLSGMGWTQQTNSEGLVADGFYSTIIFKAARNNCSQDFKINLEVKKYFVNYKQPIKINLFLNEIKKETILVNHDFNNQIFLSLDCNMGNIFTLGFEFENPISSYDLRKGLNRHKRSIILKSISISG